VIESQFSFGCILFCTLVTNCNANRNVCVGILSDIGRLGLNVQIGKTQDPVFEWGDNDCHTVVTFDTLGFLKKYLITQHHRLVVYTLSWF